MDQPVSCWILNCLPREHNIADPLLRRRGLSCRRWAELSEGHSVENFRFIYLSLLLLYITVLFIYTRPSFIYIHNSLYILAIPLYIKLLIFIYSSLSYIYVCVFIYTMSFSYIDFSFYIYYVALTGFCMSDTIGSYKETFLQM